VNDVVEKKNVRDFFLHINSFLAIYVISRFLAFPIIRQTWQENLVPFVVYSAIMIGVTYLGSDAINNLVKYGRLNYQLIIHLSILIIIIIYLTAHPQ